jgi:hypothetical protein
MNDKVFSKTEPEKSKPGKKIAAKREKILSLFLSLSLSLLVFLEISFLNLKT